MMSLSDFRLPGINFDFAFLTRGKNSVVNDIEQRNRKRLLNINSRIPAGTPSGWEKTTFAIGGLLYIGFSNLHPEKLIVISSQKQSVINCKTSQKTYCEENYDEMDLIALATELGDEIIPIAGEGGGGLRRFSKDGTLLVSAAPFWPKEQIIFMPNYASWYDQPETCTVIFEDYEIKAFGFSRCGNYMAVGNSHTLDIFKKIPGCSE